MDAVHDEAQARSLVARDRFNDENARVESRRSSDVFSVVGHGSYLPVQVRPAMNWCRNNGAQATSVKSLPLGHCWTQRPIAMSLPARQCTLVRLTETNW